MRQEPATDAAQLREALNTVAFTWPTPGVRTLWQTVYDLDDLSMEVSFLTGDQDAASCFTDPVRFALRGAGEQAPPSRVGVADSSAQPRASKTRVTHPTLATGP